ncbi:exo-alpha-sialidase [bacterium SCSIO 12643]|nr:exo-alpha-sialidase [bacterium SCSIO 12643]
MRSLIFILSILSISAFGQTFQNIKIDEDKSLHGPEEPTIAISHADSNIMMAGANINRLYRSEDAGLTWEPIKIKSKYGIWGDPCVIPLTYGEFLYFHLSLPKGKAYVHDSFLDRIVCQPSKKNGKKFKRGYSIGHNPPKDQDKEWSVLDSERNRVYTSWTQFDQYGSQDTTHQSNILASYSDDLGKTWSTPMVLSSFSGNCIDDDQTTEGAVPAIGINGEMHVAWAYNNGIYFNTYNPGQSVTQEKLIAKQVKGWNQNIEGLGRTNGMPVTVSDMSRKSFHGNLYVCWSDQRNGELNTDVFLVKSTDQGQTWSEPLKVNNDQTNTHQFLPWMTIDQTTGYIYIIFYDRRNYIDNQTDVYLAVSKDGGNSFTNIKVSESPFTPVSQVFFGDYINISAHSGVVRPIWTRYENGLLSIWTALIHGL